MRRRLYLMVLCVMLTLPLVVNLAYATSLDDVISGDESGETSASSSGGLNTSSDDFINDLRDASDLTVDTGSPIVAKTRTALSKIIGIIVQVIAYFITAGITLRVMLDLMYISLPFMQTFMSNGYQGNPRSGIDTQAGFNNGGMGGMGMGMGSMGMNGMGMSRGMGYNNGGMMNNTMPGQGTPQPSFKLKLVSSAALNAVASENNVGPDGKTISPYRLYAKDMIVTLVAVPVLLVLAFSGSLTNLGFFIGELISNGISGLANGTF